LKKGDIYSVFKTKDGREITLRPIRRSDLEALIPFANGFVKERKTNRGLGITSLEKRMTKRTEKQFLDRTLQGIKERRRVSVAAFHGSRLVGHCDVLGRPSTDEKHTGLLGIVVSEGYRGVGLGVAMVRTALQQALKLGIWAIELEVFATNSSAMHIYEKLGFKTAGIIPKKILRDGEFVDIVVMYIHLPHV